MGVYTGVLLITYPILWIILLIKKKSQMKKMWEGSVLAKVEIGEKELTCNHCSYEYFEKREGLLNTTWVLFFLAGFWNKSCPCFVCGKCGHIHWFVNNENKATFTPREY